jgi:phospholipase C
LAVARATGNDAVMHRRDFLRAGLALGGAVALGGCRLLPVDPEPGARTHSILDGPPGDSGIDTIVVCMMENRSFDSYLGWLARDQKYLERGRSLYGGDFTVDGQSFQTYPAPDGTLVDTYRRVHYPDADPWRACEHPDPGHGWTAGRAERDGGFLATGSGNDLFALGYFEGADLPLYNEMARRFVVCDRWHASLLGPTYPNREYLYSGQSGGNKTNAFPTGDGFPWPTIFERLASAGVSSAEYATDVPPLALWGSRLAGYRHAIADYYDDADAGTLPSVTYVCPGFVGDARSDDHPHGDPRAAQTFARDVFRAFVRSPQWHNGLFVLTYDEWGGFFDHVPPPHLPDDLANSNDADDFSQAGFRVPTILASPRGLPGAVDHATYDHTAVLRFLEWRFLGAPSRGPGGSYPWWFTTRDRNAGNLGELLSSQYFDPNLYFSPDVAIPKPSDGCATTQSLRTFAAPAGEPSPWEEGIANGYWERVGVTVPVA